MRVKNIHYFLNNYNPLNSKIYAHASNVLNTMHQMSSILCIKCVEYDEKMQYLEGCYPKNLYPTW